MDLAYLKSHWEQVRAGLIATLNKFSDDELVVRPVAQLRSVQQIVLHIAQEEHGEFGYGIAQTLDEFPGEYSAQQYPTKAALRRLLDDVHRQTLSYLNTLNESDLSRVIATPGGTNYRLIEMLGHLIEHEIHHRAELSLILGMLGRAGLDA